MIPNIRTERRRKRIGYTRAIPVTAGAVTLVISGFAFPVTPGVKHNVKLLSRHAFGQIFEHNVSSDEITDETLMPRVMGNSRTLVMDGDSVACYKPGGYGRLCIINNAVVEWRQRSLRGRRGERCPCTADKTIGWNWEELQQAEFSSVESIRPARRVELSRIYANTRPYSHEELQNAPVRLGWPVMPLRFRPDGEIIREERYSHEEMMRPNPHWTTPHETRNLTDQPSDLP